MDKIDNINPRELMELAIEKMRSSISEQRIDKNSPLVGAVLIFPDGRIETAYRGELSEGDHAEYTLLERKLSTDNLAGTTLFVTLEPCAPGARSLMKTSCAERIINRRISKVWIGIEDPDPLVNSSGIKYLEEHGIIVELFDRDLQEIIRKENTDFIIGAEERASKFEEKSLVRNLSTLEEAVLSTSINDLNTIEVEDFIAKVPEYNFKYDSDDFYHTFTQLKYLAEVDDKIHLTGLGILLFGINPQIFFPNAVIRATYKVIEGNEDIKTFSGSLPKQAKESQEWFKNVIGKHIDRSNTHRKNIYSYPSEVIRECLNNALAHRSYDIEGGSIHFEINEKSIIIRSPGGPVKPISMERMKNLDAPYLSKNPKITFVFEKLGISEGRGFGFTTIRNLPGEYMLPLPIVTFDNPFLVFEFSRSYKNIIKSDSRLETLGDIELKGYDFIRLNTPVKRKEYAEYLNISQKTAERQLSKFVTLNLIKRMNSGPTTSYQII